MLGKKEIIYSFALNVFSKALSYLLLLVFANFFIVEDYGKASFVVSAFIFLTVISQIGIPNAFVAYLIGRKNELRSIAWFLLANSIIFTIIGLILSKYYAWILPLVLTLPFTLFYGVGRAWLQSKHKHHLVQLSNTLFTLLLFAFTFAWHSLGRDGIIIAYAAANIISTLLVVLLARKGIKSIYSFFKFDWCVIKKYIQKSVPLLFTFLSIDLIGRSDMILIGFLDNFANVANYTVATSIASLITTIPLAISMFLLTRSAELKNKRESQPVFKRCIRISFTLTLLLGIILAATIKLLTQLFFPKYTGIEPYVIILAGGLVFNAVYILYYTYYSGTLTTEKIIVPIFGAAILNITLDLALIPLWGIYGICFATLAAHAFALTMFTTGKLKIHEIMGILSAPIFILASFLSGPLGLIILLPVAGITCFKSDLFHKNDLHIMLNTFTSIGKIPKQ